MAPVVESAPKERSKGRGPSVTWLALALLIVGGFVHANSIGGVFVWDDFYTLVDSPNVRSLFPLSESLWGQPGSCTSGRPVAALSLVLNFAMSGLSSADYKLTNILIHLGAALALFGASRQMLRQARAASSAGAGWIAFAIALLWLVHPLPTDALNHVVYRNEALMALFFLATFWASFRGFRVPPEDRRRRRRWFALAVTFGLLSAGSKEVAWCLPIIVLFADRAFVSGTLREAYRRHAGLYQGLSVIWMILPPLLFFADRGKSVGFEQDWCTPAEYFTAQPEIVLLYLKLCFWPAPLILDYGRWPIPVSPAHWVPEALIVIGLVAGAGFALHRRRFIGLVGLTMATVLAPTTSFIPITGEYPAEHRMYLPLAGIIAVTFLGLLKLCGLLGEERQNAGDAGRRAARRGAIAFVSVVVLGLSTALAQRTSERHLDFSSRVSIWTDTLEKRPQNPRAIENMAYALWAAGDQETAERYFRYGMDRFPSWSGNYASLALLLFEQGRFDEALVNYHTLSHVVPRYKRGLYQFGCLLDQTGRTADAIQKLYRAVDLDPDLVQALQRLAWILSTTEDAELRDGEDAVRLAEHLVSLEDENAFYLDTLAAAYAEAGRFEEAVATQERAVASMEDAGAHMRRMPGLHQRLEAYRDGKAWTRDLPGKPGHARTRE